MIRSAECTNVAVLLRVTFIALGGDINFNITRSLLLVFINMEFNSVGVRYIIKNITV